MADEGLTLAQRVRERYPGAYDDLSDHQLEAMVQQKFPGAYNDIPKTKHETATAEDYYKPNVFQQDLGTSIGQGVIGAGKEVADTVVGLGRSLMNPLQAAKDLFNAQAGQFDKAAQAKTGLEKAGHLAAGVIPVIGPMAANIGDQLGSGDAETMGRGALNVAAASTVSPSLRAGVRSGVNAATPGVVAATNRVRTAAQPVIDKGKAVAKSPTAKAAVGAGIGYAHGGLLGALEGAVGGGLLGKLLKLIDSKTETPAAPKRPASGKADAPRLVRPGLEKDLETELSGRIDAVTPARPVEGPMPTLADVMNQRLRDAAESPARAGATTDFTRPNPNAGGTLVPDTASMADDLGSQLDAIPSRPRPDVDSSAIDRATSERLADAAESPARARATTEFTRPNPSPNAGGRLAPEPSMDRAVREAVRTMRGERTGSDLSHPPDLPGVITRRTREALADSSARTSAESRQMLDVAKPKPKPKPEPETPKKPAETPAEPPTEPVTIGRSKSKSRPTYTENDLKAAKDKWGSTDIAELREKYGAAVDEYLLAQRALRHQQHYGKARDAAATRKGQQGILPEVRQMFEAALKERSGK
jgi:hypothetical protein